MVFFLGMLLFFGLTVSVLVCGRHFLIWSGLLSAYCVGLCFPNLLLHLLSCVNVMTHFHRLLGCNNILDDTTVILTAIRPTFVGIVVLVTVNTMVCSCTSGLPILLSIMTNRLRRLAHSGNFSVRATSRRMPFLT